MNKDYVYIGTITGVFGIKGELKVYTESDFIDYRFRVDAKIFLNSRNQTIEATVSSMRIHKNNVLITINKLYDINQVEQYVNYKIYAHVDDVPPLDEDDYQVDDLVGLDVFDEFDKYIGVVNDFIEVPQGHIMEVVDGTKKVLIPFVDEYILEIYEDQIIVKVLDICQ